MSGAFDEIQTGVLVLYEEIRKYGLAMSVKCHKVSEKDSDVG